MSIKSVLVAIACLSFFAFAALPEIRITTANNGNPDQQTGGAYKYVRLTNFQLSDPSNSRNDITRSSKPDSIRVRGNSTAGLDKKPYRIKFGENVSLFGDTAAKSWVLLANYYDGTFALNAMAFELGKRLGLEFTNRYWFVDVYINNAYKGIYQLTEQVQSHKGRVDLKEKHNGWLAEFDYHDPASDEKNQYFIADEAPKTCKNNMWGMQECTIDFTKGNYHLTTFIKSPELDDTIPNRPTSYIQFVKNDINALVNKMKASGFPTNGYRDMIDMESFAKYVLIQLVMDNFDFNSKAQTGYLPGSNYAYKIDSCGSRIKAGPLWDFDLAAGVERMSNGGIGGIGGMGSFPAHYKTYQDSIAPTHVFYRKLWEDPVFKAKYKKLWDKHKSDFQAMSSVIDQIKTQVEGSIQAKGSNKWANNSFSGSADLTTQAFNTEVQNLKSWWTNRINWVDQKLNSYNINTSADVTQSTIDNSCKVSGGSSSSKASSSSVASSSSAPNNNVPSSSSIAPSSSSTPSSSSNEPTTVTCSDYQASWCGNTTPASNTIAKPTAGQCVFVIDYTSLQVSSGGGTILINGETCTGPYTNCAANKPAAKDGGYYIYVQSGSITSSQSYIVTSGAPICEGTTPIVLPPTANLQNQPAKMEVYNLQGKLVYSGYPENPQILKILVQTKGVYIVRTTVGSEKKIQRMVVK